MLGDRAAIQFATAARRAATEADFLDRLLEGLAPHAPLQRTSRILRSALELEGLTLPAGARVCVMLGAANRDPLRFPNPDVADFDRKTRHFAFSSGPHFCAGARVAKLEGQIVLRCLIEHFRDHRPTESITWDQNLTFRTPLSFRLQRALEKSP